ncbi:MAG: hypothetical protein WBP85_08150, partial [Terracidiphilus sp.]
MNRTENRKMDPEAQPAAAAVDRILAAEEKLVPASGFAAAVMERVREEAALPPPIPFPWKRLAPGLALTAGVIGWGSWQTGRLAWPAMHELVKNPPQIPAAVLPHFEQTAWVVLA